MIIKVQTFQYLHLVPYIYTHAQTHTHTHDY